MYLFPTKANIRIIDAAVKRWALTRTRCWLMSSGMEIHRLRQFPQPWMKLCGPGRVEDDDVVALVGFGAGLTWASAILQWGR